MGFDPGSPGGLARLYRIYVGHPGEGEVNLSLVNVLKVAAALEIDAGALIEGIARSWGIPGPVTAARRFEGTHVSGPGHPCA